MPNPTHSLLHHGCIWCLQPVDAAHPAGQLNIEGSKARMLTQVHFTCDAEMNAASTEAIEARLRVNGGLLAERAYHYPRKLLGDTPWQA